jgi:glycosyltransferase involved in cell wall biosynthesis
LARLGDSAPASRAGHLLLQLGRLGASSPAVHRYANRLNGMLVARDPDLIHANGFKMHLLGARAAPPRSALVWHVHDFVGARPLMRRLLRAYAGRCDMAVANSRAVAADLRTALGPSPRVAVIYNGIDLERFVAGGDTVDLDAIAGLPAAPPDVVRVGLVATAAHWKGHRVFLRALALLPRALPVRGYVIGGAVYHTRQSQISLAALRQEVTRLGLAERVGFTGFLPDIAPALHALDIVVHPSIQPEPFGLVVAEAFACARAVITSGSGGVAEFVEPERNALVHRPGDAAGLARAIARLLDDPGLRGRLGEAARITAASRFGRQRMAEEFAALYRAMVNAGANDAAAARS